jgi:hypothetical protein
MIHIVTTDISNSFTLPRLNSFLLNNAVEIWNRWHAIQRIKWKWPDASLVLSSPIRNSDWPKSLKHSATLKIEQYVLHKRRNKINRVIKKSLCTWWLQYGKLQSDCLAADRQGQGDTRLTLRPSVIPNSNYVFMVCDWIFLKYFCVFFVL